MTHTAPEAQTQYEAETYLVTISLHLDPLALELPWVDATLSHRIPTEGGSVWLQQSVFGRNDGQYPLPITNECLHVYLIETLDRLRVWIMQDHHDKAVKREDTRITPGTGVSIPTDPGSAG